MSDAPGGPIRDFEAAYQAGTPPWDIGGPQPEVVKLAEEGEFRGAVVDVGCGTGENAVYLSSRGLQVVGLDSSPTALARAREKATARGLAVPFLQVDAMVLSKHRRRYDTALDCGLFHVFPPFPAPERRAYAEGLASLLAPGSTLHVLCFSDAEPPGPGPYRVAEHELRQAFRSIFALTRIRPGRFAAHREGGGAAAWVVTLVRV